jgi:hypothetical protein
MNCQIPGCNNVATTMHKKDGIFSGVYLSNKLKTCNKHSQSEIETSLQNFAENRVLNFQKVNPFTIKTKQTIQK